MDKETKACPLCGKEIAVAARKCKHCREMIARECPSCCEIVAMSAEKCDHCGELLPARPVERTPSTEPVAGPLPVLPQTAIATVSEAAGAGAKSSASPVPDDAATSLVGVLRGLERREHVGFAYDNLRMLRWFAMANAAVVLSIVGILALLSGGESLGKGETWGLVVFLLVLGSVVPFIMLAMSKFLAKQSHNIRTITNATAKTDHERQLVALVTNLAARAGLPDAPEVGIYESQDMNAFATGMRQTDSLVAFSSALLNEMDGQAVAAVAAHEIAHIANGDMITMTIVQSAVNAFVLLISIPLSLAKLYTWYSDDGNGKAYIVVSIIKFAVVSCLLFLGNLVVKAFSRRREFEADRYAAQLTSGASMVSALKVLGGQNVIFPNDQKAYAAFKICSPAAMLDILSTHPSIDRRIEALARLGQPPRPVLPADSSPGACGVRSSGQQ